MESAFEALLVETGALEVAGSVEESPGVGDGDGEGRVLISTGFAENEVAVVVRAD